MSTGNFFTDVFRNVSYEYTYFVSFYFDILIFNWCTVKFVKFNIKKRHPNPPVILPLFLSAPSSDVLLLFSSAPPRHLCPDPSWPLGVPLVILLLFPSSPPLSSYIFFLRPFPCHFASRRKIIKSILLYIWKLRS